MNRLAMRITASLLMGAMVNSPLVAAYSTVQTFEDKTVAKLNLIMESTDAPFDPKSLKTRMSTKEGDPFHQLTFDNDLKMLSEDFDRVAPTIEVVGGKVYITVRLWQKPVIKKIQWQGNRRIKASTLSKELGVKAGEVFDRDTFNKGFIKVKELYFKKGYFQAQGSYRLVKDPDSSGVIVEIDISEGRSGHVGKLEFKGFSDKEESEILSLMATKKYNFLISWVTGRGIYREDMMEHDKLIIVNYLQNKGYADAQVDIKVIENPKNPDRLILVISAEREQKFHFGKITFSGNRLFTNERLDKVAAIQEDGGYSPDNLRQTVQNIKDLYGHDGYIEASVSYQLQLDCDAPIYNVHFDIEEGEQYRVGLIRVLGNCSTEKRVILHQTYIEPGEVFDSQKLKATEYALMSTGYFKSVNVYPVKSEQDSDLGPNFRDVVIEVEETQTGSMNLFFGASSVDNIFGGLEMSENNFNHKGLTKFWKDLSALRGGGEIASAKFQIGKKQNSYTISWMDPYYRDTKWRVGFDANYTHSTTVSDNFDIDTGGGTIFGAYPWNAYWTGTLKWRIRNAVVHVSNDSPKIPKAKRNAAGQITNQEEINKAEKQSAAWEREQKKQNRSSGLVMGIGASVSYDSTDRPYKPHSGFRSILEAEIAGAKRHDAHNTYVPFMKFQYLNTYYYPASKRGTFKMRADFKALQSIGGNGIDLLPFPERFVMGGQNSVRGYEPFSIGPLFPGEINAKKDKDIDPEGGASSMLLSLEYLHEVFPPFLDLFAFLDGGMVDKDEWAFDRVQTSVGVGARIEIAGRLPFIFGYGYPLNPKNRDRQTEGFFFSMGGQF